MKNTLSKKDIIISVIYGIICVIFILFVLIFVTDKYCDSHPSYYQDDVCFRVLYRCQIECGNYGLNYTSFIDPCYCGCGQQYKVSICTGMRSEI